MSKYRIISHIKLKKNAEVGGVNSLENWIKELEEGIKELEESMDIKLEVLVNEKNRSSITVITSWDSLDDAKKFAARSKDRIQRYCEEPPTKKVMKVLFETKSKK